MLMPMYQSLIEVNARGYSAYDYLLSQEYQFLIEVNARKYFIRRMEWYLLKLYQSLIEVNARERFLQTFSGTAALVSIPYRG